MLYYLPNHIYIYVFFFFFGHAVCVVWGILVP